ncbi:MAG TPA: cobalamin-dependent protein, partial [Ktedonobacterales bacterium]
SWHAPAQHPPHPQPAPAPTTPQLALAADAAARETSPLSLARLGETLLTQLISLHERAAIHTIAEALGVYPLEDVCDGLFAPVLGEIGQLWAVGHIGCAAEHFSSAVIRAQLESLFRCAPQAEGGPSLVVGCAPGNLHEIGPLILALFLRRLGVRVAYLGQNVDAASLASLITGGQVAGVVLSAALPEQASALAEVARQLGIERTPAASLYVGGRAFQQQPALADQLPGCYLGMSAPAAALEIKRRFAP